MQHTDPRLVEAEFSVLDTWDVVERVDGQVLRLHVLPWGKSVKSNIKFSINFVCLAFLPSPVAAWPHLP